MGTAGLADSAELLDRGYEGVYRLPRRPVTYHGTEELTMRGIRRIVWCTIAISGEGGEEEGSDGNLTNHVPLRDQLRSDSSCCFGVADSTPY